MMTTQKELIDLQNKWLDLQIADATDDDAYRRGKLTIREVELRTELRHAEIQLMEVKAMALIRQLAQEANDVYA